MTLRQAFQIMHLSCLGLAPTKMCTLVNANFNIVEPDIQMTRRPSMHRMSAFV
jgi:hypothetical protein